MYDLNLPSNNVTPNLRSTRAGTTAGILRAGIAALTAAHARWRLRRDTARQLDAIPDRLLRDIGLPRSEIWKVASDLVNEATRTHHRTGRE